MQSLAGRFGSGRVCVYQNISGQFRACIQNFFITRKTTFVFSDVTSVNEVIVIFLQRILFANTAAFFYFLLGLVSHCFWEGDCGEEISTRWRCVEKSIIHVILVLFQEAYKLAFHLYRAILESFFYAYSAIVDNFIDSFFFLEKHYIPECYRWLTCYVCTRLCQCFGQGGCYFRSDKRLPPTTPAHHVFCYSAVVHTLTTSVNLAFRPKSGFKNKCRAWPGFEPGSGFKMRPACNSVWVFMQGPNKGRLKGYIFHLPTVKINWNHFVK